MSIMSAVYVASRIADLLHASHYAYDVDLNRFASVIDAYSTPASARKGLSAYLAGAGVPQRHADTYAALIERMYRRGNGEWESPEVFATLVVADNDIRGRYTDDPNRVRVLSKALRQLESGRLTPEGLRARMRRWSGGMSSNGRRLEAVVMTINA